MAWSENTRNKKIVKISTHSVGWESVICFGTLSKMLSLLQEALSTSSFKEFYHLVILVLAVPPPQFPTFTSECCFILWPISPLALCLKCSGPVLFYVSLMQSSGVTWLVETGFMMRQPMKNIQVCSTAATIKVYQQLWLHSVIRLDIKNGNIKILNVC